MVMSAAMAVFIFSSSMSCVTLRMVLWIIASFFSLSSSESAAISMRFQQRSRKRLEPLTASSDQVATFSKSPINMI